MSKGWALYAAGHEYVASSVTVARFDITLLASVA